MSELLNLPDLALERVLLYVGVESLLRNVVRVNKYMYNFIHSHPHVLQHYFFLGVNEVPIFQDPAQIEKILKHARIFHCFELPYMTCTFDKSTEFMNHCMNKYFVQSAIYINNLEWLDLSGTQISKLSFLKHLYNLDTLVLDSCQKIDVKEFENLKFCNQLSNLNAGFTNLDGETLVKVIKPPIVHIDISGIMLDLDHVKGLLKVCHSTLLTVHCGINNSVSKEQFEDVNRQYRDVCFSFSPPRYDFYW